MWWEDQEVSCRNFRLGSLSLSPVAFGERSRMYSSAGDMKEATESSSESEVKGVMELVECSKIRGVGRCPACVR